MTKNIQTILGPIAPKELGSTLMHEHIFVDAIPGWWLEPATPKDIHMAERPVTMDVLGYLRHNPLKIKDNLQLDDAELAIKEIGLFKKAGGCALVEVSLIGMGDRRMGDLINVARQTGVHIIVGSGFYMQRSVPEPYLDWTEAQLADHIIKEITLGIEGSDSRAGIIGEVGTSSPIAPFEERSLVASARAQRETGACITVHIAPEGAEGLRVLQILKDAGADLSRVILDHMDEHPDLDYHRAIMDQGAVVEYDTFGAEWYYASLSYSEPRDMDRINNLVVLLEEGFADQIVLSHDVWLKFCLVHYGGMGYAHLLENIVPMMQTAGITDEQIQLMLVENPQRLMAF